MFQEWSPLEFVVSRIPPIGKYGRNQDITSIAATGEVVAFGSNCGSVFWYNRREDTLLRLDCWSSASVSCMNLVETVDFMLAVGSTEGDLQIFQIPRPIQTEAGVSFPGTVQSVQQYPVQGLHNKRLTALKWSANGEKLFAGDKGGQLSVSTIDFFLSSVSSRVISKEDGEIFSLDYQSKLLLVSTIFSTFAYNFKTEESPEIVKIGVKPRKPGAFASCILQTGVGRAGLKYVVVRPNDRLWVANVHGQVERTVILKESLKRCHSQIPLLNPSNMASDEDCSFQYVAVLSHAEQTVLLWNNSSLHVVSLLKGQVLSSCNSIRNVIGLSIASSDEFFVLETGRSVLRIASIEDRFSPVKDWRTQGSTASQGPDTHIESTLGHFGSRISKNIPQLEIIKSMTPNLSFDSLRTKLSAVASNSFDNRSPSPEVFDALLGVDYSKPGTTLSPEKVPQIDPDFKLKMDKIGESEFDSTICVMKKSTKLNKGHKFYEDKEETINEDITSDWMKSLFNQSSVETLTPLEKEETLLKMLNIETKDKVCLDDPKHDTRPTEEVEVQVQEQPSSVTPQSSLESFNIGYGPPSDTSSLVTHSNVTNHSIISKDKIIEEPPVTEHGLVMEDRIQELVAEAESTGDNWIKFALPGQSGTLCQNRKYLCFCDNRENVFYASQHTLGSKLVWKPLGWSASSISTSINGDIVWKLYRHTAYCNLTGNIENGESQWHKLCDNVASIWVSGISGWIVKLDGGLVHHSTLSAAAPYSPHPRQIYTGHFFSMIREFRGNLVGKTVPDNQLAVCSINSLTEESSWAVIQCPIMAVSVYDVGTSGELWISDSKHNVHVSKDWIQSLNAHSKLGHVSWSRVSLQMMTESNIPAGVLPPALCKPILSPGEQYLWLAPVMASHVILHKYPILGHQWSKVLTTQLTNLRVQSVYGGGREAYSGNMVINIHGGPLLLANPQTGVLSQLAIPHQESVCCVSTVPGYVWLLTMSGKIFIMVTGASNKWKRLDLGQLGDMRLVSISIASTGQVWAVDSEGGVHMRLGSLDLPPAHATPAWLPVDNVGLSVDHKIIEVTCSSSGDKVWLRDCSNNVYVREGVFPDDHPVGTGWVPVTGLSVQSLAASRSSVWAVSSGGQVYRRLGLSSTDWLGDTWSSLSSPGPVTAVTCGQCDTVWSVDISGALHQLSLTDIGPSDNINDEDWTMLQQ